MFAVSVPIASLSCWVDPILSHFIEKCHFSNVYVLRNEGLLHGVWGLLLAVDARCFNSTRRSVSLPWWSVKGECRKMVMLLLPDFISSHFGTFITQGRYHKSYFVLGDYAVE